MQEHILLYEELNQADVKEQISINLSDSRHDKSAFTSSVSKPFIAHENFDTPIELMDTIKKYITDNDKYQKLVKVLVVAAMKYRSSAPKEDKLSERVYNF